MEEYSRTGTSKAQCYSLPNAANSFRALAASLVKTQKRAPMACAAVVLGSQGKPLWTVLYSVPLLVSVLSGDMAQQAQASVMNKNNGLCVGLCAGAVRCHANASPGISVDVMLLSDIIFFSSI